MANAAEDAVKKATDTIPSTGLTETDKKALENQLQEFNDETNAVTTQAEGMTAATSDSAIAGLEKTQEAANENTTAATEAK